MRIAAVKSGLDHGWDKWCEWVRSNLAEAAGIERCRFGPGVRTAWGDGKSLSTFRLGGDIPTELKRSGGCGGRGVADMETVASGDDLKIFDELAIGLDGLGADA